MNTKYVALSFESEQIWKKRSPKNSNNISNKGSSSELLKIREVLINSLGEIERREFQSFFNHYKAFADFSRLNVP